VANFLLGKQIRTIMMLCALDTSERN